MQPGRGEVLSASYQFSSGQWELECHSSCKLLCSIPFPACLPCQPGSSVPVLVQISPKFMTSSWLLQDLEHFSSPPPFLCSLSLGLYPWTRPTEARSHHLSGEDVALQVSVHQHLGKTCSQKTEPSCPNPLLKVKQGVVLEKFLGQF